MASTATLDPRTERGLKRAAEDPALFIRKVFGEEAWSKQREVLVALKTNRKVAVVGCHAPGKSWIASRYAIYFWLRHPASVVVTTAPTWHQVDRILWREIRKAAQIAESRGLRLQNTRPQEEPLWKTAKAGHVMWGFSSDRPANLQGIHERKGLLILDEAAGIDERLWPALRSILAGSGWQVLALGNPDTRDCEFYSIVGSADWAPIRISAFDCPNFTNEPVSAAVSEATISREYEREMRERYGEDSPIYRSKVLAEFPSDSADTLILWDWIARAKERASDSSGEISAGLDVGRQGPDLSALSILRGNRLEFVATWHLADTAELVDVVDRRLHDLGFPADAPLGVDADGLGAGVADQLRVRGWNVCDFHGAGAGATGDDQVQLLNQRAVAWWALRQALRDWISLTADEALEADLRDLRYAHKRVGQRIVLAIEEKDAIRKRRGKSPDAGDSAMMALWARDSSAVSLDLYSRAPMTGEGDEWPTY